jgi:hypothetical protein
MIPFMVFIAVLGALMMAYGVGGLHGIEAQRAALKEAERQKEAAQAYAGDLYKMNFVLTDSLRKAEAKLARYEHKRGPDGRFLKHGDYFERIL